MTQQQINAIMDVYESSGNAELTNRLIKDDPGYTHPEWAEYGTVDRVPVIVYYRTTPEDERLVDENGGDWGAVDWRSRVVNIVLDSISVDRFDLSPHAVAEVCQRYNITL